MLETHRGPRPTCSRSPSAGSGCAARVQGCVSHQLASVLREAALLKGKFWGLPKGWGKRDDVHIPSPMRNTLRPEGFKCVPLCQGWAARQVNPIARSALGMFRLTSLNCLAYNENGTLSVGRCFLLASSHVLDIHLQQLEVHDHSMLQSQAHANKWCCKTSMDLW